MKTIFLSDLHIGIDAPTNLYQSTTDQANLKRILKYVQDNGSQVKDLVILGDWVDLWMYGTTVVPPTATQIFQANPQIFTRQSDGSGDFVSCLESIQGTIHYINGNHDITVTADEIAAYFGLQSKKLLHYTDCSKQPNGYASGPIFGEHGHWYSMLCKPYKGEALPLGYYVTRAGMQVEIVTKAAPPAMNVGGMQEMVSYNGLTLAQALLTSMASQIGFTSLEGLIFTMPDGSTINAKDVADKFKDLSINDTEFLRADVAQSLNVAAGNVIDAKCCQVWHCHNRKMILVFGHTHIKELFQYGKSIYANTGFICANEPDASGIPVTTFLEIEDTKGKGPYTVSLTKLDYKTGAFSVDKKLILS